MNLDLASGLDHIFGNMPERIGRRRLSFDFVVFHPVDRHDLRTSVIAHVDAEVDTLVGTGIDGDMHIAGSAVAEHNDVAGSQLTAVYIVLTSTDLLKGTLVNEIVHRLAPSGTGLGVPAGGIDGIHNELCVSAFYIDDVIEVVGNEGRTAQALVKEFVNIRGSAGRRAAVSNSFLAGGAGAIIDSGENITRDRRSVMAALV